MQLEARSRICIHMPHILVSSTTIGFGQVGRDMSFWEGAHDIDLASQLKIANMLPGVIAMRPFSQCVACLSSVFGL